jgi:hypothetical protein
MSNPGVLIRNHCVVYLNKLELQFIFFSLKLNVEQKLISVLEKCIGCMCGKANTKLKPKYVVCVVCDHVVLVCALKLCRSCCIDGQLCNCTEVMCFVLVFVYPVVFVTLLLTTY